MRLLQVGAGNIGRGYMAHLFHEAGFEIVFADAVEPLVESLNAAGRYTLRVLDAYTKEAHDLTIGPVRAVSISDGDAFAEAVAGADVLSTAVGVPNLARIAAPLAGGLLHRRATGGGEVNIFLCENTLSAGVDLSGAVRRVATERYGAEAARWIERTVGFVGTSVARMVPVVPEEERERDPLRVVADAYRPLPYDAAALRDKRAFVPELEPRHNFAAEVQRKLFLYNLLHASLAYLGYRRGFRYVHQTLEQPDLREIFIGAAREISYALEREYPEDITDEQNARILSDILVRYANPLLRDTVRRVARDPLRKLSPNDRLIGAATLCLRRGVEPVNIAAIIAAALEYRDPDDPSAVELETLYRAAGPSSVLRTVGKVEETSPLFSLILERIGR